VHLHPDQQARAIEFLNSMPWGDVDGAVQSFETALRLALEATGDAFLQWEQQAEARGYDDEFSLTYDDLAALSDEWRLAYVARLLRSLALAYGVSAGFDSGPLVGEASLASLGDIVRTLNDISWIRLQVPKAENR
jgi:hypothetical protein